MADWIKYLAQDWGHWMRKVDRQSISGTLGRIQEQGLDGAAIRGYVDHIPIIDFPRDVQKFHHAYKRLDPHHQKIIFLDFRIANVPHGEKCKALGLKKDTYYRRRRQALDTIVREMAFSK